MKLEKSIKVRGQVIPAGTNLEFSNEGFATYAGMKLAKAALEAALAKSEKSVQKLAKAIRLGDKVIPAGTELAFSNEGYAEYNGEQISIYQIPTAAFESYAAVQAAIEANNEVDKTKGIKAFDSLEPGDVGTDVNGEPVRFLGKAMGKAGYDELVGQFGNTSELDFDALTVNMDEDEIAATGFVAYSTKDGSVCVGVYGPDAAMATESTTAEMLPFSEVQSGDDAVDWEDKPCMIVSKGKGLVWYKKMLDAIKCPDCLAEIKKALNVEDDSDLNDTDFVLVINDKQEKNLANYGEGGVKVYKKAEEE